MLQLRFLNFPDIGLLLMRLVIGISFIVHGWPKISGGGKGLQFAITGWESLGNVAGAPFAPVAFGFLAAFAEFVGGFMLVIGFMTRIFAILLLGTMIGALNYHVMVKGDAFQTYSHALELGGFFLGLILIGPGKISVDKG